MVKPPELDEVRKALGVIVVHVCKEDPSELRRFHAELR
jgi:hypothetical protein